jgi:hypothetical protein
LKSWEETLSGKKKREKKFSKKLAGFKKSCTFAAAKRDKL